MVRWPRHAREVSESKDFVGPEELQQRRGRVNQELYGENLGYRQKIGEYLEAAKTSSVNRARDIMPELF